MTPSTLNTSKCRLCGNFLGRYQSYVLGPAQCISQCAEAGPCHRDCATKQAEAEAGGSGELRTVWTTKHNPDLFMDYASGTMAFRVVSVYSIAWISPDGKPATYAEIESDLGAAVNAAESKATSEDETESLVQQIAKLHHYMPRRTTV